MGRSKVENFISRVANYGVVKSSGPSLFTALVTKQERIQRQNQQPKGTRNVEEILDGIPAIERIKTKEGIQDAIALIESRLGTESVDLYPKARRRLVGLKRRLFVY